MSESREWERRGGQTLRSPAANRLSCGSMNKISAFLHVAAGTGFTMPEQELHVVTGAFGYSGKYIASRLLQEGYRVRTLTNSPHRANPFAGAVEARPFRFDDMDQLTDSLRGAAVLYNTYWVRFSYGDSSHSMAVENTLKLFLPSPYRLP